MIPTDQQILALHKKYAPNDKVLDLVLTHCKIVDEIAQWAASRIPDQVDAETLHAACMLHDIGTYVYFDAEGTIANEQLYPIHALIGSQIVIEEGISGDVAQIIRTHVLMGLTRRDIATWGKTMPDNDFVPSTIEGDLICYADRFHSKHPQFNDPQRFLAGLRSSLPSQADKFERSLKRFGLPNIAHLAEKYQQTIV